MIIYKPCGVLREPIDTRFLEQVNELATNRNKWIEITTSSLKMGAALANHDNEIYKNWLFVNKQLQDLSSCDSEIKARFVSRFEELKKSIMEHGRFLRQEQMGYQLYPNGADQYIVNFISYEFGMVGDEPSTQPIRKARVICYDKIKECDDLLKSIAERTSVLKKQVKDTALEVFKAKNPVRNVLKTPSSVITNNQPTF